MNLKRVLLVLLVLILTVSPFHPMAAPIYTAGKPLINGFLSEIYFYDSTDVVLTSNMSGETIYYTTNGSTPTTKSTKYTNPIKANKNLTIKAITLKDKYKQSSVSTLNIIKISPPSLKEFSSYGNLNSSETMIKAKISGSTISISGTLRKIDDTVKYVHMGVMEGKEYDAGVDAKGYFSGNISVDKIQDGTYYIGFYALSKDKEPSNFRFNIVVPLIKVKNGDVTFDYPQNYKENYLFYKNYNRSKYITPKEELDPLVVKKTEEITKGLKTNSEKLLAISSWISDNIYYDYDEYNNNPELVFGLKYDASYAFATKKGVCHYYAVLTRDMCHAAGIPCEYIVGVAAGIGHAWNEAFVDNRWVIIDNTWNSKNQYSYGLYEYKGFDYSYYDISFEKIASDYLYKNVLSGR